MRTIDTRWAFLTKGLQVARQLDALARAKSEEQVAGPDSRLILEQKRYDRQLRHFRQYYANYPRFLAAWQAQANRARDRLYLLSLFGVLSACSVVGLPVSLVLLFFIVRQYQAYRAVQARRPLQPSPPLQPAGRMGRTGARGGGAVENTTRGVVEGWWRGLKIQEAEQRNYGSIGANTLLEQFTAHLSDSYIAFKELLVQHNLDVDVLLIGPTGIWVLEVKHLAGQVFFRQGRWYQLKDYYEEGGVQKTKSLPFEANLDEQWQRERENIERTIRRRTPDLEWVVAHIHGGIVFTHPDIVPHIDPSCRVAWGAPAGWLGEIQRMAPVANLTMQQQLRIADALLDFANQIDPNYGSESAVDLAQQVHARLGGA